MTTNTTTAEDRLGKLGIHLPDAPRPFGASVESATGTRQKALALNLDAKTYGTFAEIGAG